MPRDNFPPCLGPLTTTRHPNAPSPEASHGKRVRRGKKKRVPSRSPGPSQNAPGPQRLAHGLPQCLEVKLCWVPSRVLGKREILGPVTRPSGRGLPSCSGAVSPASQHAPRHPKLGHSPTPVVPALARRWRLHARALRLRFGRLGERASERASSGRVRGPTDQSRRSVGRGAKRMEKAAELTPAGVAGSAAHGPAGLGTV